MTAILLIGSTFLLSRRVGADAFDNQTRGAGKRDVTFGGRPGSREMWRCTTTSRRSSSSTGRR